MENIVINGVRPPFQRLKRRHCCVWQSLAALNSLRQLTALATQYIDTPRRHAVLCLLSINWFSRFFLSKWFYSNSFPGTMPRELNTWGSFSYCQLNWIYSRKPQLLVHDPSRCMTIHALGRRTKLHLPVLLLLTMASRCDSERSSRSSFQTMSTSPGHTNSNALTNPGRSSLAPKAWFSKKWRAWSVLVRGNTHVANQHKRITIKMRFPYSNA